MREILFRGKDKISGEWISGFLVSEEHIGNWVQCNPIIPETVGQFTGLYDSTKWEALTDAEKLDFYKQHYIGEDGMSVRFQHIDDVKHLWKGKKIFEGDILSSSWGYKGEVEFDAIMYAKLECLFNEDCEVVGNIHDNPELLEVSK